MEFVIFILFIASLILIPLWSDYESVGKAIHITFVIMLMVFVIGWLSLTERQVEYTELRTATSQDGTDFLYHFDIDGNIKIVDNIFNHEHVVVKITHARPGMLGVEANYKVIPKHQIK